MGAATMTGFSTLSLAEADGDVADAVELGAAEADAEPEADADPEAEADGVAEAEADGV
jgi:hypothetical protein